MERANIQKTRAKTLVHFVCIRCKRQLVWAEATVTVQCPSCGRWIKANPFWALREKRQQTARKSKTEPQQLLLF